MAYTLLFGLYFIKMRIFLTLILIFGFNVFAKACSVCGGSYTDGEVVAYKNTTLLLLLLVVSMMVGFFYWIFKKYAHEN